MLYLVIAVIYIIGAIESWWAYGLWMRLLDAQLDKNYPSSTPNRNQDDPGIALRLFCSLLPPAWWVPNIYAYFNYVLLKS